MNCSPSNCHQDRTTCTGRETVCLLGYFLSLAVNNPQLADHGKVSRVARCGAEVARRETNQRNQLRCRKNMCISNILFISDISFLLTIGHIQCLKCDPKNNTSLNLVTRKTLTFENYKKWLQQFGLRIIHCDVKVRLSRLPELF